jgi:hypothetical protein
MLKLFPFAGQPVPRSDRHCFKTLKESLVGLAPGMLLMNGGRRLARRAGKEQSYAGFE